MGSFSREVSRKGTLKAWLYVKAVAGYPLNRALKGIKRLWNRIPDGLIAGTSPPYARVASLVRSLQNGFE